MFSKSGVKIFGEGQNFCVLEMRDGSKTEQEVEERKRRDEKLSISNSGQVTQHLTH